MVTKPGVYPFTKASVQHEYSPVDISSRAFWSQKPEDRDQSFAQLRADDPVSFHPSTDVAFEHSEKGFWAITRADDIQEVARHDEVFLSGLGNIFDPYPADISMVFFHTQDGELHKRNRALVSGAFTPKRIAIMLDQIHVAATEVIDDVIGAGDVDFVQTVAARLPAMVGARLMGIPKEHEEGFIWASNASVGRADKELGDPGDPMKIFRETVGYIMGLGRDLAAYRRKHPSDDLVSTLLEAEVDGERLTDDDIGEFTRLMSVASSDTTKQSTSHALWALHNNPDQQAWLMEDFEGRSGTAMEEFVRWASPVIAQTRTANQDYELNGSQITTGDKVVLFYASGNRDETRFDHPEKFDLSRNPNPQIAFGAGGVHYCMGSRVALAMLKEIYGQLFTRTKMTVTGEIEYTYNTTINAVKRIPVHFA